MYVDGRYTFQANTQINAKEIQPKHLNSFWTDLEKIILETEYKIANDNTKIIHCVVRMFLKKKIMEIEKINKGTISIPAPFGINEL